MTPLLPIALGLVVLAVGIGVLRSFGPRYRIGRLLAATPKMTVADAVAAARAGTPMYVRIDGRIDSEEDFPDEHHRPLVYRRQRLQLRRGSAWQTYDDKLQQVPFEVHEGLDAIAVDGMALDEGLVVLPREAVGTAEEVPDQVPPATPPATPIRMRIDQVSAVEHATVLGMPVQAGARTQITAGLGRPLILTTLEVPEAMRILGGGSGALRPLLSTICLAGGLILLSVGLGWAVVETLT